MLRCMRSSIAWVPTQDAQSVAVQCSAAAAGKQLQVDHGDDIVNVL